MWIALSLAKAATEHPGAFTCADYREAFSKYGDKFDAVIVATPDHSHAPIMLTALANNKHVYGQKPLVHQLEELVMMEKAIAARPHLVTQVGNQRMALPGRRAAVEILRSGVLGKAVEAHVWVNSPNDRAYFNLDRVIDPTQPAAGQSQLGSLALRHRTRSPTTPASPRSSGARGGTTAATASAIGAATCSTSSFTATTNCSRPSPCKPTARKRKPALSQPTLQFHHHLRGRLRINSPRKTFAIHYRDSGQPVSRAAIGLPPGKFADKNMTVVVCENGVLTLSAGGFIEDLARWQAHRRPRNARPPRVPAR